MTNRYRLLCGGLQPDDRTFGRFLERLGDRAEEVLSQVIALSQAQGLGAMRTVCVDGTKVQGNVSTWSKGLSQIERSDPDVRPMLSHHGIIQGYNCQLAVDSDDGLIVGAQVLQEANDSAAMVPAMDAVLAQSSAHPGQVVADKGYENGKSLAALESLGIVPCLASGRIWPGWSLDDSGQAVCPSGHHLEFSHTVQNRKILYEVHRIRACPCCPLRSSCLSSQVRYKTIQVPSGADVSIRVRNQFLARSAEGVTMLVRRRWASETPFAQLKEHDGIRRFSRRGLAKVRADFHLWASSYNIRKLIRLFWAFLKHFRAKNSSGTQPNNLATA